MVSVGGMELEDQDLGPGDPLATRFDLNFSFSKGYFFFLDAQRQQRMKR